MRHRVSRGKLGRPTGHRISMLKNLVVSFFERERIRTTIPRARELRSMAEHLITLAKRGSLHHRRQVLRIVTRRSTVSKLFDKIAPRFAARNGGYTRMIKVGPRLGDGADTAYLELIGSEFVPKVKEKGKKGEKKVAKETEGQTEEPKRKREKSAERVDSHAKTKAQKQHIKAPTSGQ